MAPLILHIFLFELLWILIYIAHFDVIWPSPKNVLSIESMYLLGLSLFTSGQHPNTYFNWIGVYYSLVYVWERDTVWYSLYNIRDPGFFCTIIWLALSGPKWALNISSTKRGSPASGMRIHSTQQNREKWRKRTCFLSLRTLPLRLHMPPPVISCGHTSCRGC